jgi:sugar lactone lactonase YvrE
MGAEMSVDLVVECRSLLGEGVTWDAATSTLLWLDIDGRLLHRLHSDGRHDEVAMSSPTSVVVPTCTGELLAVSGLKVGILNDSGVIEEVLAELPPDGDGRANDGRCDPHGRLWIGTVDRSGEHRAGVFCVDDSGFVRRVRSGRALSNGIDWSPDGSKCYHVDSLHRTVDELTLDDKGFPVSERTIATFDVLPDGVSVDMEGGIWVALWDGGGVVRLSPSGEIDCRIDVPGGWITSCAFGGVDLRTLYISSATVDLDEARRRANPSAGSLFACRPGVAGRGYTPFGTPQG